MATQNTLIFCSARPTDEHLDYQVYSELSCTTTTARRKIGIEKRAPIFGKRHGLRIWKKRQLDKSSLMKNALSVYESDTLLRKETSMVTDILESQRQ